MCVVLSVGVQREQQNGMSRRSAQRALHSGESLLWFQPIRSLTHAAAARLEVKSTPWTGLDQACLVAPAVRSTLLIEPVTDIDPPGLAKSHDTSQCTRLTKTSQRHAISHRHNRHAVSSPVRL